MTTCVGRTFENQPSHHLGRLGFLFMIKHASKGSVWCPRYGIIHKHRGRVDVSRGPFIHLARQAQRKPIAHDRT
jgi:hypothetical protein